jgi:hypothetical protein
MSNDFLSSIWMHPKEMAIGFQSGLAAVFMLRKPTAKTILGCVVMSVFAANLFGPAIADFLRFVNSPYYEATIAGVGVAGSAICYGIIHVVKLWFVLFEEKMR